MPAVARIITFNDSGKLSAIISLNVSFPSFFANSSENFDHMYIRPNSIVQVL